MTPTEQANQWAKSPKPVTNATNSTVPSLNKCSLNKCHPLEYPLFLPRIGAPHSYFGLLLELVPLDAVLKHGEPSDLGWIYCLSDQKRCGCQFFLSPFFSFRGVLNSVATQCGLKSAVFTNSSTLCEWVALIGRYFL